MKKKATLLLLSALASQTETAGYLIDAVAEKNKEEVLDEKEKKLLNIGIAIVAVYAIARVVVLSEKVLNFIGFDFGADDEEESEE